ncbi:unnamed protein product [Protopolystoma xenopodis]|uniref:Uncharacterized protein n=1 Tax=Protopolystoma xenopodis TaxID=117903 RepID=A0A448XKP6_9PLAT|nr:unnamed protein product [Protopolystoma xenopodis]
MYPELPGLDQFSSRASGIKSSSKCERVLEGTALGGEEYKLTITLSSVSGRLHLRVGDTFLLLSLPSRSPLLGDNLTTSRFSVRASQQHSARLTVAWLVFRLAAKEK